MDVFRPYQGGNISGLGVSSSRLPHGVSKYVIPSDSKSSGVQQLSIPISSATIEYLGFSIISAIEPILMI